MVLTTAPSARWLIKEAACYPETEPSDLIAGGLITKGRLSPAPDERIVVGGKVLAFYPGSSIIMFTFAH